MTTLDIEIALSRWLNYRINIVVPNVSWGLGVHECDILLITKTGYATEYEIKTSLSDLKADANKYHQHRSNKIRRLWFVVPDDLGDVTQYIPERAGLLHVNEGGKVKVFRQPKQNTEARKLKPDEILKAAHLGAMRIWGLKANLACQILSLQGANNRIMHLQAQIEAMKA